MFQVIAHLRCTQETWSCLDLRHSSLGAGTADLLVALWRCSASSITPLSDVLLFLLVRGNFKMRNGAQLIGTNGKRSRLRTPVSASTTMLLVLIWEQMVSVM